VHTIIVYQKSNITLWRYIYQTASPEKFSMSRALYSLRFSYHKGSVMNVDKAKKRIAKLVKKGLKGYPQISLEYFGKTSDVATEVVVTFTLEEGAEPQKQKIASESDAREDETIQSVLVKIIERANPNTVTEIDGVSPIN